MVSLRGSCLCGGVSFEVTEPFETLRYCHCESCKKLSGSAATVNARVPSTAIRILEGEDLLQTFEPPGGSAKTFCLACGTNLFGGGWPESDQASVRLSAIDDPLPGAPAKHIYTRSLASWETLPDDGLERVDGSG